MEDSILFINGLSYSKLALHVLNEEDREMQKLLLVLMILVTLVAWLGVVPVEAAPTIEEVDLAIQNGLAWLAAHQNSNGSWGSGSYILGNTAAVLLAFEDEGHFPGTGTEYAANVEKGLDYMLSRCYIQTPLPEQTAGDPDTNGNEQGVYFSYYRPLYESGLCLMALVASNTPDREVTTGACAGMTYREVGEDVIDYFAWAQEDSGSMRGGWRYTPNNGSDNSAAQWPVLGLIALEQWGLYAPDFLKDELNIWVNYVQHSNGGSGYTSPGDHNVARTGALLVEHY